MTARALLVALALLASMATPAWAQAEVHGSSDVYAAPDVALVWGVLRGASDADTMIVIRIVANAKAYASVAVYGINPFSKAEQPLQPPVALDRSVDVQVPRTRFAELPRTELRFYATAEKRAIRDAKAHRVLSRRTGHDAGVRRPRQARRVSRRSHHPRP